MSTAELDQSFIIDDSEIESAPLPGADFYLIEGEGQADQEAITDMVLESDAAYGEGDYISSVFELRRHMSGLIHRYRDRHDQHNAAVDYSSYYREEIIDQLDEEVSYEEHSALTVAKVYLSTLETLGQLGKFIEVNKWVGRKTEDAETAKVTYLASRKKFQDDIDDYFEHFAKEQPETLYTNLTDSVNLARLTMSGQKFVNAETDNHTHVFLGSVLSERAVMMSLRDHVNPEARYGTEDEDRSPTKADVVFPISGGDMYVQVKMRWQKPTELKVQPKKTPPHVVVPMTHIRSYLTVEENAKVAEIISAAAERKVRQLEIEGALALGGLRKYRALFGIPTKYFKEWWDETKDTVSAGSLDNLAALQTGVD